MVGWVPKNRLQDSHSLLTPSLIRGHQYQLIMHKKRNTAELEEKKRSLHYTKQKLVAATSVEVMCSVWLIFMPNNEELVKLICIGLVMGLFMLIHFLWRWSLEAKEILVLENFAQQLNGGLKTCDVLSKKLLEPG